MAATNRLSVALLLCATCVVGPARADLALVRDVQSGAANGAVIFLGSAGGKAYFTGDDGVNGAQLWATDGTPEGTAMTAALISAAGSINPSRGACAAGDTFVLSMDDGFYGEEPWRSDASAAGTWRMGDLVAGGAGSVPAQWTSFGNVAVFSTRNELDLWLTDGATATYIGPAGISLLDGPAAGVMSGSLYYVYANSLRHTAGTAGDIGLAASLVARPSSMAIVNDRIFLAMADAGGDVELWMSDGTQAGTARLKDVIPGAASGAPQLLTRADDRVFFSARDLTGGRELWVSDGTEAGTVRVKDIRPGILDSNPMNLTALGGTVFFIANDGAHGKELWRSDGTEAGTVLVQDFRTGSNGGFDYTYDTIQALDGRLLLIVNADTNGFSAAQPWTSDGTAAGTRRLSADALSMVVKFPYVAHRGRIYVAGSVTDSGREPYALAALDEFGPAWCETPELPIRDQQTSVARISLPSTLTLTDLRVAVDLFHGDVGDLQLSLRHVETDTVVTLLDLPASGCHAKAIDIAFDSAAAAAADTGCDAGARTAYARDSAWLPTQSLTAFAGESFGGTWELSITDGAAGSAGVLHGWCLSATAQPLVDPIFGDGFE